MLFRKKTPRVCIYCANGTQISDEQILCSKHGVVTTDHKCRKFCYDPCKRIPPRAKAPDFAKYDTQDFSL